MHQTAQGACSIIVLEIDRHVQRLVHQRPHPLQEALHAGHTAGAPRPTLAPRPDEHKVESHRIRAEPGNEIVGIDDVPPALRHLLAVLTQDDTMVEQAQERLPVIHQPQIG
ncbi:hypothetical protein HRbin27_01106 [bacterium HR27]|nr:hypothetical protein HRbin27_01106 [bacterium HR27]